MTTEPFDDDLAQFSVTFVRAVIAWNGAEGVAYQRILDSLAGGSLGARAAITHLQSRGLQDTLLTIAYHWSHFTPPLEAISHHVRHFVEGLDTLRAYRNFYIHSLEGTGADLPPNTGFGGKLGAREAKGRFAWVSDHVTTAKLQDFRGHCEELETYGHCIADYLYEVGLRSTTEAAKPLDLLSSLQKPLWPEKLKKNRQYLEELPPPPGS